MNRNAVEIIKEYNAGRRPEILEKKFSIMASDPFSFFRGTCHLFYRDLIHAGKKLNDPTDTWICGDLHLENFGVYKGENQLIYFDINDFDESTLAPCTYDLTRFISSLYLSKEILGLELKDLDDLADHFLKEFSRTLVMGKARVIEEPCASGITLKYFEQIKARTKKTLLREWMEEKEGKFRFKKGNPHILGLELDLKKSLFNFSEQFLESYYPQKMNLAEEFEINKEKTKKPKKELRIIPFDAGFRIAGTGSLGLNRFIVALELEGKIKFLDIKQSQFPSINLYQKGPHWNSDAERICTVQNMMQGTSPSMLSYGVFDKHNYVIRSLQPEVDKLNLLEIKSQKSKIKEIIGEMALVTASAYIRSSGWKNSSNIDHLQAFGAKTDWQKGVLEYGKEYSEQVQKDFEAFRLEFGPKKVKKEKLAKQAKKTLRENVKNPGAGLSKNKAKSELKKKTPLKSKTEVKKDKPENEKDQV